MPIAPFAYTEGTITAPQHTKSSEACFLVEGTNLVHFPDGRLTPIPSFVDALYSGATVTGQCRGIHAARLATASFEGAHYLFGTHSKLFRMYRQQMRNVTPLKTVAEATLGTDPLSVTDTSTTMTVTYVAHGLAIGDRIKLTGATDTGGVLAAAINKEHIVTGIPTADTFTITTTAATSTTTGGGAAIEIFLEIADGREFQEFFQGYGAGTYGEGAYGASQVSATQFTFPRIWSFDNFGGNIIMCPGDYEAGDGQKIYIWDGDDAVAPQVLLNAPTNCNWVFELNNHVIALCGNQIRTSLVGDATTWTGVNTEIFEVQRTNRLLSGVSIGDKAAIVFAPEPYLLTDTGVVFDLRPLGEQFAIMSPRAFAKFRDGLMWYGADHKIYFFNGTTVQTIINHQNGEYIRGNISQNNIWTSFMLADPKHDQLWFYYPSGSNKNPSDYVIINPRNYAKSQSREPSFTTGQQDRTAAQQSLLDGAFYMADSDFIYNSFTTQTRMFDWQAKTAAFYVDGTHRYKVNYIIPDYVQEGNITLTVFGLSETQRNFINYGSFNITPISGRVHTRGAGKLLSFQFSGSSDAMVNTMQLEVQKQGRVG